MSYVKSIFERTNLQHIQSFIAYNSTADEITEESYEDRILTLCRKTRECLNSKFQNEKEFDEIYDIVNNESIKAQDVYMEIGMQCGAFLMFQLLKNFMSE